MTTLDDQNPGAERGRFEITRRGYDRVQVDDHLARVEGNLRTLKSDRDAAESELGDLREQVRNLDGQVKRLSLPPTTLEGLSERLQNMLQLAQDEANDTKQQAEADAGKIREQAEVEATKLKAGYEQLIAEVEARREALEAKRDGIIATAKSDADAIVKKAEDVRDRADAEMVARHEKVEAEFKSKMATREADAMQVINERDANSKADAERRLREATDKANRTLEEKTTEANRRLQEATNEANRRVNDATQEAMRRVSYAAERVRDLRRLRQQINGQMQTLQSELATMQLTLDSVHTAFAEAGPLLEQGDDEQEILNKPPLPPRQALELPQVQLNPELQADKTQSRQRHGTPKADTPTLQIDKQSVQSGTNGDGN